MPEEKYLRFNFTGKTDYLAILEHKYIISRLLTGGNLVHEPYFLCYKTKVDCTLFHNHNKYSKKQKTFWGFDQGKGEPNYTVCVDLNKNM